MELAIIPTQKPDFGEGYPCSVCGKTSASAKESALALVCESVFCLALDDPKKSADNARSCCYHCAVNQGYKYKLDDAGVPLPPAPGDEGWTCRGCTLGAIQSLRDEILREPDHLASPRADWPPWPLRFVIKPGSLLCSNLLCENWPFDRDSLVACTSCVKV